MTVRSMVSAERADLVALLRTLSASEWDMASLCAGWKIRDVVAHLLYDTIPLSWYLLVTVRYGLSADRFNAHWVAKARDLSPTQLTDRLECSLDRHRLTKLMPAVSLADNLIHHQDIRRPLERARVIPTERLRQVLNHPDPFANVRRRMRGLRFEATDLDWSQGSGPLVRGSGEAIALAVAGRPVVLDELDGDGVARLRTRMS
jgi:uncharacterized protein (TIGR03083 family)